MFVAMWMRVLLFSFLMMLPQKVRAQYELAHDIGTNSRQTAGRLMANRKGHTFLNRDGVPEIAFFLSSFLSQSHLWALGPASFDTAGLSKSLDSYRKDKNWVGKADTIVGGLLWDIASALWKGNTASLLQFDELSALSGKVSDSVLLYGLTAVEDSAGLKAFFASLDPPTPAFRQLQAALQQQAVLDSPLNVKKLSMAMNYLRWINHIDADSFILVNICSATLKYYRYGEVQLTMRTVLGSDDWPTPRFGAYCNQVILYPYWHVPRHIAVQDFLPILRRKPQYLEMADFQVLDKRGRVIDPKRINWKKLSAKNFPYTLRQYTGCDNALGVVKFNLTDPFSVYMHDTPFKGVFLSSNRYYSHGCIRLEKPVELGNLLLGADAIDTALLNACVKGQKPVTFRIRNPVPVMVVYMPAEADTNQIHYFRDAYKLLR